MTKADFVALIAPLETQGVAVTEWEGLDDNLPRLVWREWYIEQDYADNRAVVEHCEILAEYYTADGDDAGLAAFKAVLRAAELPFTCDIDYDETTKVIRYQFKVRLFEAVDGG